MKAKERKGEGRTAAAAEGKEVKLPNLVLDVLKGHSKGRHEGRKEAARVVVISYDGWSRRSAGDLRAQSGAQAGRQAEHPII